MSGRLRKGSTCPFCATGRLAPIVYGLPTSDLADREASLEIVLGGCVVTGSDPELACHNCERRFMRDGEWVLISER